MSDSTLINELKFALTTVNTRIIKIRVDLIGIPIRLSDPLRTMDSLINKQRVAPRVYYATVLLTMTRA